MASRLYVLVNDLQKITTNNCYILLQQACISRGIEFRPITAPLSAYTFDDVPELGDGGLYKLSTANMRLSQYMYALRLRNPQLTTWHDSSAKTLRADVSWGSVLRGQSTGIAVIPTLFGLTSRVDEQLMRDIEAKLGGFPVIVKMSGGSHGRGVLVAESKSSFKSLVGHIADDKDGRYVLRKFIPNARNLRLVVLNGAVISATEYKLPADDFRSNATKKPIVVPAQPSNTMKDLAIRATANAGVHFGGVDLLVDESGEAFVAEVNTPCNFARSQMLTGDDIAGQLVEFLTAERG